MTDDQLRMTALERRLAGWRSSAGQLSRRTCHCRRPAGFPMTDYRGAFVPITYLALALSYLFELCEVPLAVKLYDPIFLVVADVTVNVADALAPGATESDGVL